MVYFKMDSRNQLVDMRALSKNELKVLLEYYQRKLNRARQDDMKKAYNYCVQQISEFMYEGKASGPPDILSSRITQAIKM